MLGDSDDPGNNGVPGVQINPGGAHSQTGVTGGTGDKSGKSEYEWQSQCQCQCEDPRERFCKQTTTPRIDCIVFYESQGTAGTLKIILKLN